MFPRKIMTAAKTLLMVACLWAVVAAPACAQEASPQFFVKPSLDSIVKTLIRTKALDINKDHVIDLYARMVHCDLVQVYYKNDFEWEKIRTALREEIRQNIHTFPLGYAYETGVRLGRYDFDRKLYRFMASGSNAEQEINVNTFTMESPDKRHCEQDRDFWLPAIYRLVLNKSIKIPGLYMSEDEGEALLKRLQEVKDDAHVIYMRVNLRVAYVTEIVSKKESLLERKKKVRDRYAADQSRVVQQIDDGSIQMDSLLDSIEFYEDSGYKNLIYTYRPYGL